MRRLLALALLIVALPAQAADVPPLGPLGAHADLGSADGWTASLEGDAYQLANDADPGAIRYYHMPVGHPGRLSVRVEVSGPADGPAGAGLLYALQGDGPDRLYYAFVLSPGGRVALYRRDADGFGQLLEVQSDDLATGPVVLEIREAGDEIEMTAGGRRVGTFGGRGVGAGNAGIVAFGAGRFRFADFRAGP